MRRAVEEPGLWQRLANGIEPPRTVAEAADGHLALYSGLVGADRAPRQRAA